ncbi:MAG: zinc-finger protein [Devosia sp.]|jgi:uncharacterized protein (DUF983 family)|nr:zinc-finger protein [Devosia sp.]
MSKDHDGREGSHGAAMVEGDARSLGPAMLNGLRCRCPRCGQGKLFRRYLKVAARCENCGLDFSRHRADDLPAYVAITIVGHILVVGLMHFQGSGNDIAPAIYLAVLIPLAIIMPLAMLPSIKGGIVALQWSRRMYGF